MRHHDHHYRRLFSQPALLRALVQGILPAHWSTLLNLDTLEAIPTDHQADGQRSRQGDLLWRVRRTDGSNLYLLLLLEHQSRGDRMMPVRILSYAALAYETLVRRKLVSPREHLPVLLPIVLYTGLRPWKHADSVSALVDPVPEALADFQPRMRFVLIDQGKLVREGRLPPDNLASLIFQLEHNEGVEHAGRLLQTLTKLTRDPALAPLYHALGQWVRHILLPRAWPTAIPLPDTDDLTEITTMASNVHHSRDWTLKFRQEGWREGLAEGKLEGQAQGIAQVLETQLHQKFGLLPDWAVERIRQADAAVLQQWAIRVLQAQSLEAVLLADG